ncbi:hypothetical protein [Bacillus stercoris]|uniref:hypothetical protein n=1 Tax=Bacillus stercoris TaxID=2054641 RepID=UPI003CEA1C25
MDKIVDHIIEIMDKYFEGQPLLFLSLLISLFIFIWFNRQFKSTLDNEQAYKKEEMKAFLQLYSDILENYYSNTDKQDFINFVYTKLPLLDSKTYIEVNKYLNRKNTENNEMAKKVEEEVLKSTNLIKLSERPLNNVTLSGTMEYYGGKFLAIVKPPFLSFMSVLGLWIFFIVTNSAHNFWQITKLISFVLWFFLFIASMDDLIEKKHFIVNKRTVTPLLIMLISLSVLVFSYKIRFLIVALFVLLSSSIIFVIISRKSFSRINTQSSSSEEIN